MAIIIDGTNGDDDIVQSRYSTRPVEIYGYDGDDDITLNVTSSYGGENFVDAGDGDDYVLNEFEGGNDIDLGDGNDIYIADIRAGDANSYDIVEGGSGNDRFEVNSEESEYYGESGNDTFLSVGFDNYFEGGSGSDTISYQLQDDDSFERGKGVTIDLADEQATTGSGHHEELISIENAIGTNFGDDDIAGSSGRNILKGLAGDDLLEGLGGVDKLYGGAGDDDLDGGSGDDLLVGGLGFDYLVGGSGEDTFDFNSVRESVVGSKRDIIDDFHRTEFDVVDLSTIDANELLGGNQAFTFISGFRFSGEAGELRFIGGVMSGDTDGDRVADFQIKVSDIRKMYVDDFFL